MGPTTRGLTVILLPRCRQSQEPTGLDGSGQMRGDLQITRGLQSTWLGSTLAAAPRPPPQRTQLMKGEDFISSAYSPGVACLGHGADKDCIRA